MGTKTLLLVLACFVIVSVVEAQWRGHVQSYRRSRSTRCLRCICWYRSRGCYRWRPYSCTQWYTDYRCKTGWRHRGDYNCNIPICYPGCNGGRCTNPNDCTCPSTSTGQFCQTLTCSYANPCYPGNCYETNKCNCTQGFLPQTTNTGCTKLDDSQKAFIGRSTAIITHFRDTDQALLYYFLLDATEDDPEKLVVWSNQQIFNRLSFEFEAKYNEPEEIAPPPAYVNDLQLGIVYGDVRLQVTDFRGMTMERSKYQRECPGTISNDRPAIGTFNCSIDNLDFKTLVEDADTLSVDFRIRSGGSRRLLNLDTRRLLPREPLTGVEAHKHIEFKFDFRPPKFCKENTSDYACPDNPSILTVFDEFTKDPISLRWAGWADTQYGSGMWYYYLELHTLLVKDARLMLTEDKPIEPIWSARIMDNGTDEYTHNLTPQEPGIYSILMELRDVANNSRLARRFVLYDPVSEIELDSEVKPGLHVATAARETGYRWQSTHNQDGDDETKIDVSWREFFVNHLHEDGYFLNEILEFPTQFNDIVDDQLMVKKFVDAYLEDNEGERTTAAIPNLRGIVKFEYAILVSESGEPLENEWTNVPGPNDRQTVKEGWDHNGQTLYVWVRAHDIMGNIRAERTVVTLDSSNPRISNVQPLEINDNSTENSFDSTFEFDADDTQSGVFEIEMDIIIHTPGKGEKNYNTKQKANVEPKVDDGSQTDCYDTKDPVQCFRRQQRLIIDHCWFMLPVKDDLDVSNATVDVTVYNQAMLTDTTQFEITRLTQLAGLEIFTGPQNVRIVGATHESFRIEWDQPDQMSCYGRADLNIVITYTVGEETKRREHRVSSTTTFFDVGKIPADTHFIVLFSTQLGGGGLTPPEHFSAQTGPPPEDEPPPLGLILGVALGVLFLVALVIIVFFFLVRRGVIKPRETAIYGRVTRVKRAATRVYRERVARSVAVPRHGREKTYYDNRQSELYIYGEMDLEGPQVWHLERDDISLEAQIKSGNFASIYKATHRGGKKSGETAVAKILHENYTADDELLMKAKINFFGSTVGDHPNILKFVGAVVSDPTLGPFMIYEYCENGTMKEYLVAHKNDMSIEMQDNLFRFGLDVAKGMEYIAGKGIVHRRLAARNILLTFLNEVKIAGFGPQAADEEVTGDAESGKKERIPIKWAAPECMSSTKDATEKSDVWSYAVVLWEIFTMGDTPYSDVRGKDLPSRVKKGTRLPKPEQCDDTWYDVMTRCWSYQPQKRPDFGDIRMELDNLFVAAPGDDYYYYKR